MLLDDLCLKRNWGGEVKTFWLLTMDVAQSDYREILGVSEGDKQDRPG